MSALQRPLRFVDTGCDVVRQSAAICVAQDDDRGAGILSCDQSLQGILSIVTQTVEEVFGVVEHFSACRFAEGHGVGDHLQVLFESGVQHIAHVQVPCLADDSDDRGLRIDQCLHAGVIRRGDALASGHAERRDASMAQRGLLDFLEILEVLGVGERIAALDEVDAHVVEPAGDEQLVLQREVDALPLAAIAKRRVINTDAGHDVPAKKKP